MKNSLKKALLTMVLLTFLLMSAAWTGYDAAEPQEEVQGQP